MGVDISGRNPIIRGTRPEIDWDTATEEVKEQYWEDLSIWQRENPGDYFRANWWSWRPIHLLIEHVNQVNGLGIDTSYYGSNDGAGPEDQETCNRLADALQEVIDANPNLVEDDDTIYLVLGSWTTLEGHFISQEKMAEYTQHLPEVGSIIYHPLVMEDGAIITPSHGTAKWHLQNFIDFLRECGGFEIC